MTCRCQGAAHSTSDCVACSVDSTHRDETREAGQEPPEKPRIYDAHFAPCTLDLAPSWAPAPNKEGGPSPLPGRWTKQEHLTFLRGLRAYGRDWNKIQKLVGTRSQPQVRSHAQKYFQRITQAKESGKIGENDFQFMMDGKRMFKSAKKRVLEGQKESKTGAQRTDQRRDARPVGWYSSPYYSEVMTKTESKVNLDLKSFEDKCQSSFLWASVKQAQGGHSRKSGGSTYTHTTSLEFQKESIEGFRAPYEMKDGCNLYRIPKMSIARLNYRNYTDCNLTTTATERYGIVSTHAEASRAVFLSKQENVVKSIENSEPRNEIAELKQGEEEKMEPEQEFWKYALTHFSSEELTIFMQACLTT